MAMNKMEIKVHPFDLDYKSIITHKVTPFFLTLPCRMRPTNKPKMP